MTICTCTIYFVTIYTCMYSRTESSPISAGSLKEDLPDAPQFEEKEPSDIFQADTPAILRQNSRASMVRQSTLQRHNSRNSSVRKTSRPGDISTSQSSLAEPLSPTHVSINLLDEGRCTNRCFAGLSHAIRTNMNVIRLCGFS